MLEILKAGRREKKVEGSININILTSSSYL